MQEELVKVGMQLVLHGGEARERIRKAMKTAIQKDFQLAHQYLEEGNEELIIAHKIQTEILQKACSGEEHEYNVLFTHGMDTLMTVKSEYEIAVMLIDMIEVFHG